MPVRRFVFIALATLFTSASAGAQSHLMRYADVHGDRIVFTYEGDLWIASTEGGDARRITSHDGAELHAKFSPDGKRIAFTGQYDGGTDVYVMDAGGGVPERLTYHPAADLVLDWYPDGEAILFRSRREYPVRVDMLYRVPVAGGLPEKLPVDSAGLAALSPDAKRIAYNRITREDRTWKRHQGGTAQDLWLGSLAERDYRRVTDWRGTDNFPMWRGDKVYFTSDRQRGTLNLFSYDVESGDVAALTDFGDYDVKYPSIGPRNIVFQHAESLHLLDLDTGQVRLVPVRIPTDRVRLRPTFEPVTANAGGFRPSPDGKRLLLEARGEILDVPVEKGEARDLTRTPGSREKNPVWSPDGKRVVFVSDRSGEEELWLVERDGEGEWRRLTTDGAGFRMQPVWSPDGGHLAFSDKFMKLNLLDVETGDLSVVDRGEYDDGWERWGIQDYVWSPDGRWIAYTKLEENLNESIFLFSLDQRRSHRVTKQDFADFSPSFDPGGDYLYFLSHRTLEPVMGFVDQNHVFLDTVRPYLVCLREDQPSPFAPDGEEEAGGDAEDAPFRIDLGDFVRRTVVVEGVPAGNYFRLEATEKGFLYLSRSKNQFLKYQAVNDRTRDRLDLLAYDLESKKAEEVLAGIENFHPSGDGKKLAYRSGDTYGVVDVGKEASVGDGKVDLSGVRVRVDRTAEFRQIFDEAWRVQRDWFYDPRLHAVDWAAIGEKYRRFLPSCGDRSDLNYLIGEMIGELDAGHTYVFGGDFAPGGARVATGLLGVAFESPPRAAYHRIAHVVPGDNADERERSPFWEPGCPVEEGDYLIAIDGEEVPAGENPYRFLVGKADKVVALTFNDRPERDGARTWRTRTLASEWPIRYREWVEGRRAYVQAASGGTIGYLHLPDMMQPGLIEFARAFYALHPMRAIIIDERYNGGGFVGDQIIDRLERRIWAFTQPREGKPIRDPERGFHGHLAVVVNEHTGSNGEYFARAIQLKGLAPIIGMRTWGGAVGIEPHQDLVDGGVTTPPQFAPYGLDGEWLIEGVGVVPDIEVQNQPADVLRGKDPQLDEAIEVLLARLAEDPMEVPAPPPYPDKSKPAGSD